MFTDPGAYITACFLQAALCRQLHCADYGFHMQLVWWLMVTMVVIALSLTLGF